MHSIKTLQLKLIPNSTYNEDKLSLQITNKDYYLYDLISRKRKEKKENTKISQNDIINKTKRKINNIFKINRLDIFTSLNKTNKNRDNSNKNVKRNLKYTFFTTAKIPVKYNHNDLIQKNKKNKFVLPKKIKNPLIITSLNKNISDFNITKNYERNKLKKFKRSFTSKNNKENYIKLYNNNLSLSSLKKNLFKTKISEGTQINIALINENKFINKPNSAMNRYKYCSPKSIIFQKKSQKIKSADDYTYV